MTAAEPRAAGGANSLQGDDVVTRFHAGDALAYRFDNTGALVPEDDGESPLGVVP